jgi:uncharacterized protein YodC (DUF2158 family)
MKAGDVVQHKRRAIRVKMTVEAVSTTGIVRCVWFDREGNRHLDNFSKNELRKVKCV